MCLLDKHNYASIIAKALKKANMNDEVALERKFN